MVYSIRKSPSSPIRDTDSPEHFSFGDATSLEGSDEIVVPATSRKRSCSITLSCPSPLPESHKKITSSLESLSVLDFLDLSSHDLKEGVGTSDLKIKKVVVVNTQSETEDTEEDRKLLHQSIEKRKGSLTSSLQDGDYDLTIDPICNYLAQLQQEIKGLEKTMKGYSLKSRMKGAEKFTQRRKDLAIGLFEGAVRPKVECLMAEHQISRTFDAAVAVAGYNRLFTRTRASMGTDVDFMLVIDTDDQALVGKIRSFVQRTLAPSLKEAGIVIESDDYLMTDLRSHSVKLDDTRSALFYLANMFNPLKERDNIVLLTGSQKMLREKIFHFTDEQIVWHYTGLLRNHGLEGAISLKDAALKRDKLIDHLQRMANCEVYIGKNPYKETIQTVMATEGLEAKRKDRSAPFPIKFCISRIGDLVHSTTIDPSRYDSWFTQERVDAIEALGTLLSNIVCYQTAPHEAPVTVQEGYADISLQQMRKLSFVDKSLINNLLGSLDIEIDPYDTKFTTVCYDSLWSLADRLHLFAVSLETRIFEEAAQELGD